MMELKAYMGIYVYVELIHFVLKQKLTHHCKALYSNKDVKKIKPMAESEKIFRNVLGAKGK